MILFVPPLLFQDLFFLLRLFLPLFQGATVGVRQFRWLVLRLPRLFRMLRRPPLHLLLTFMLGLITVLFRPWESEGLILVPFRPWEAEGARNRHANAWGAITTKC